MGQEYPGLYLCEVTGEGEAEEMGMLMMRKNDEDGFFGRLGRLE